MHDDLHAKILYLQFISLNGKKSSAGVKGQHGDSLLVQGVPTFEPK